MPIQLEHEDPTGLSHAIINIFLTHQKQDSLCTSNELYYTLNTQKNNVPTHIAEHANITWSATST